MRLYRVVVSQISSQILAMKVTITAVSKQSDRRESSHNVINLGVFRNYGMEKASNQTSLF